MQSQPEGSVAKAGQYEARTRDLGVYKQTHCNKLNAL